MILLVGAACGSGGSAAPPEGSREVVITSGDAELDATVMGDGASAVVISHGANGRRNDFYDIVEAFAEAGFVAIAYDARRDHRVEDLESAVAWAREQGATRLVLLGGSYGACLSVTNAVALDADVVIGLSTAPDCEANAIDAARDFGDVVAQFVVAEGDDGFVPTAEALADATDTELIVADGDAHGSGVTNEHPEIIDDLVTIASEPLPD